LRTGKNLLGLPPVHGLAVDNVMGTLSPKHNFKGSLSRHSTLGNIYETINSEQDKTKTLQPSCKDLVTSKERITDAPIN